jgi:hypothetical protein
MKTPRIVPPAKPFAVVARAIRMLESRFDRILTEPASPGRAATLRALEERRTALADSIGAC